MAFTLPTNEEKYTYVHSQFERIAKRYDFTNDAISFGMHRLWKAKAVDILLNSPGQLDSEPRSFLDVCCGTGDLAITIAKKANQNDKITGLDFSNNMLNVARSRTNKDSNNLEVEWLQGDAQNLPFETNSFDGAIISFGLRNLTDINKGISELSRVVKPGKLVINLDLGDPQGIVFAPMFKLFFRYVVPVVGSVLQNDQKAYTYLPESMNTYPNPDEISNRFRSCQLEDVVHIPLAGGSVALHHGKAI